MKKINQKGVSLVELVITLVIMSIAFYALISVFSTVVPRNVNASAIITGTHLLNEKMEENTLRGNPYGHTFYEATDPYPFQAPFSSFHYYVSFVVLGDTYLDKWGTVIPFQMLRVRVWGPSLATIEADTIIK